MIWTKVTLAAISYEVLDKLLFSNPTVLEQLQLARFQLLLAPRAVALPGYPLPQAPPQADHSLPLANQDCCPPHADPGCQLPLEDRS